MGPGTLNFPAKKKEAARVDYENYKFAQRIMNQRALVDSRDKLNESHQKNMKTLQMISHNSRVSINKLVEQNSKRFQHIDAPMASVSRLPPLKSPRNPDHGALEFEGLAKKKIVTSRRTKSLVKQRPNQFNANVNFSFATK